MKRMNITIINTPKMLLLFIFISFFSNSFSQNKVVIDSLLFHLEQEINDTTKVNTLNELSWEYRKTDFTKAKKFAKKAKKLGDSIFFDKGSITSLNRLGTIAIFEGNFDEAEEIYLKVLKRSIGNPYGIARANNQLGEIYRSIGDYDKALQHSLKSLQIFKELKKDRLIALVSNNIGELHKNLGNLEESIKYFLLSIDIRKKLDDLNGLAFSYLNLGGFYMTNEDYPKALNYLKKGEEIFEKFNDHYELEKIYSNFGIIYLKLNDYDKSLNYFNRAIVIQNELGLNDPYIYNNLGSLYYRKHEIDRALKFYLKSLNIQNDENKNQILYADVTNNIADIYFLKEDYINAIKYYKEALRVTKNSGKKILKLKILKNLSNIYIKLKDYKIAIQYNDEYLKLNDSLEKDYVKAIYLKENYEKEQAILIKNKELTEISLKKSLAENNRNKAIIIGLLIVTILLITVFFLISRAKQNKQKIKILEQEKEIENQKVKEILKNQELKAIDAMMTGQENERLRIAKDLHDRLGSMLSMVKVHFKSVEDHIEQLKISNVKQYEKANELLDSACEEVRKISHDMASSVLSQFGLIAALEDLKDVLEESNQIEVEFVIHGLTERLNSNIEITVYRIIQELINNVLKHANAKLITIQLINAEDNLNIIIEDDGIGFEMDKNKDFGIGLKNVESRVYGLKGDLNIDSTINIGTTVTINIPLNKI
ncbi:sensor histidine kinase [Flavivirga aquimarina]|uniref:histidine kinase n=1 Tax=Flavivirga aquimarina TaxID=2027862 RepID=A0ABT8W6Z6_9FLAO|nr:sensor histidine kinase [Flavivirga aquimarina]MDO5968865.1 sensor histidine kinase [Flavivirga aquimarina]